MNTHKKTDDTVKYYWIFPYRWNLKNIFKDVWNPKEKKIFPPRHFGIGWGLNCHAILKKITSPKK